jgi:diguanylate cyclase (GGDEF)-like protein
MLERLGLPRPRIATKLYGTVALMLAVVYVLAGVTIHFATRTEETAVWTHEENLKAVHAAGELEQTLAELRRLVTAPPRVPAGDPPLWAGRYRQLADSAAALLQAMGQRPGQPLSVQLADLDRDGSLALALAGDERTVDAAEAGARYAQAAGDFEARVVAERQARAHAASQSLDALAARSRTLIAWVSAAAAVTGLLLGPIGVILLGRILARFEGVGSALLRLARNDTSVDIPGLGAQDEVGQLARSVAVFKAKSIELLQKKGEAERLNLQLDAAINNMPLGLSMFDAQGRLLVCNKTYAQMFDLPHALTRPGTLHVALWEHRVRRGARHVVDGEAVGDAPSSDPSAEMTIEYGAERIISVARQPLKGGGWVSLHEDITQRCLQEREITHLALHDPLTTLANRAYFRAQLQQALQRLVRGQGFAVLCLDLDRFKIVNDTLGHPVGDALLKQVSERLVGCVRQGDLVARLGGDEFAIIQANVRDPEQCETLASRIVETVSKPYDIDGQRIDISTSIGVTLAPRDGSDADQLMKNADLALYRTKSQGRRGYSFFKPEMTDKIEVRRTFETDLRKALEQDKLDLFYQPLVCLQTQKVAGVEALLRWTHPTRADVPAAEIVAVAEEIGLIAELGSWALRRACAQAVQWPAPIRMAINLSHLQIRQNLIENVLQALADTGLAPERLELEITEGVLLQDSSNTIAVLHQLRQLGVRVTMDDFGTGYGSVSYLRSFPFDKIKLDQSFIADIEKSEEARALAASLVGVGRSLGMDTVAEGIENFEQLRLVRNFGFSEAQGFYFSPAVPARDIARLLEETFGQSLSAA